tara:strand:+ start:1943 stop:4396 length:2454 start_codon:yes stop_codon:yes gene_type:complete
MKLTLEQALQKGIEARKDGQIQKAKKHLTEILSAQPRHPHANHNMGLLADTAGNTQAALDFFKTALEASPKINKFWLSYIGALIKLGRPIDAQAIFNQAKANGLKGADMNRLEKVISDARMNEPSPQEPEPDQLQAIINTYTQGQIQQALSAAIEMLEKFPNSVNLCNIAGASSARLMQFDNAIVYYLHAIKMKPDFAEAYYNMGSALQNKGDLVAAINSYQQALRIKPDYTDAYYNMGNTLKDKGDLVSAIESYKQAIQINPRLHEAFNNMGNALKDKGDLASAIQSYKQAIQINPAYDDAYYNIGKCLQGVVFTKPDADLKKTMTSILELKNLARPKDISAASLSLLKLEPTIKKLLINDSSGDGHQSVEKLMSNLCEEPLLLKLMSACPLDDLEFEVALTHVRSVLLLSVHEISNVPQTLRFQSALALQCFTNEYLYNQTNKEIQSLTVLEALVEGTLLKGQQPRPQWVLCLASYKALHHYKWSDLLTLTNSLQEVVTRQVIEPHQEHHLKNEIAILQKISNKVSSNVSEQYEANPYPRWVDLGLRLQPSPIANITKALKLELFDHTINNVDAPNILIAGCGTGQHSIATASIFKNANVLAIDLSLSSLAYAKRKTQEMGFENIEYMQADILDLGQLDRKFDIIESSGVLHHMEDPRAGWRVLTTCINSGGLMKIGLYSELARQHIVKMRQEIKQSDLGTNDIAMQSFRNEVIKSKASHHQLITSSPDFYSMSSLRDLLFHVQEHQFTIPQIKQCLAELGLKFCGFEADKALQNFRLTHVGENDPYDLDKWNTFEQAYPDAFAGMYQFWCQKVN